MRWFGCSVPFTGSSFSVVWFLQSTFRWEMLAYQQYFKSDVLTTSCWTETLQQRYLLKLSFTEAITVMLLSLDKMAELPHRPQRSVFAFILTFGPIEIKAIDLTYAFFFLAICIIVVLLIFTYYFKVLFLQLSLCVQCVTGKQVNRNPWPQNPGVRYGWMSVKGYLSDPNNRLNCCICLLNWGSTG